MGTVFRVRRPNGKLCAESLTHAHAAQEIKWQIASGFPGPFTIEQGERDGCEERWGGCAPQRPGFKWCGAKNLEMLKRYARGDAVNQLAEYFGTSVLVVCRKAREFGFAYRIDDPRTFEKHRGRWTDREEHLVNFMYDEGAPLVQISEQHPRTQGAIRGRLDLTAPELSTRSRQGRFIVKPGVGRRGISHSLETTGGD